MDRWDGSVVRWRMLQRDLPGIVRICHRCIRGQICQRPRTIVTVWEPVVVQVRRVFPGQAVIRIVVRQNGMIVKKIVRLGRRFFVFQQLQIVERF